MNKKLLISFFVISLIIAGVVLLLNQPPEVKADSSANVWGFAWAGIPQSSAPEKLGLGWISFNSINCDANSNGRSDGTPPGCPPAGTAIPNYGVNIESSGNLTGFAWSEYIGYIDFNPTVPNMPGSFDFSAKVDLDGSTCGGVGKICGWARACNVFQSGCSGALKSNNERGDWDGWIKLAKDSGDSGQAYQTSIDTSTGEFHGWAWGDDVMGWISFNCDNPESPNSCASTNNYHVQTDFSFVQKPTATNLKLDNPPTYCPTGGLCSGTKQKGHLGLNWFYDGDNPQSEYTIQISTNPGFGGATSITKAQTVAPGSSGSTAIDIVPSPSFANLEIGYNHTYYFRIKVKDNTGLESDNWSNTATVTTKNHAYPWICFSHSPAEPVAGEPVEFTDNSEVYGGTSKSSISWQFQDGNPSTANTGVATSTFSAGTGKRITLTVSDSDGFTCSKNELIDINLPMPGWTEE